MFILYTYFRWHWIRKTTVSNLNYLLSKNGKANDVFFTCRPKQNEFSINCEVYSGKLIDYSFLDSGANRLSPKVSDRTWTVMNVLLQLIIRNYLESFIFSSLRRSIHSDPFFDFRETPITHFDIQTGPLSLWRQLFSYLPKMYINT